MLLLGLFVHSLAPSWNDGASYYSHSWVVAAMAVALMLYRWREAVRRTPVTEGFNPGKRRSMIAMLGLCVAVVFVARMVWTVDVTWRLPLWAQAFATVSALAISVYALSGKRALASVLPVMLLLLLCVPWPFGAEQAFVNFMTNAVVDFSTFCLRAIGTPVNSAGNSLLVAGQQLMVAEGCSGLRSFQGSLAGALLVAEYFQIRAAWRTGLVAGSLVAAFLLNALRVLILAKLVDGGTEITVDLHDRAGNLTIILLFALIFVFALWLERHQSSPAASRPVSTPDRRPASA